MTSKLFNKCLNPDKREFTDLDKDVKRALHNCIKHVEVFVFR